MMNFLKKQWLLLLIFLVAVTWVGFNITQSLSPEKIVAIQVLKKDTTVTLTVTGEVESDNTLNISAPFNGTVQSITVDEGDKVSTGQLLVTLDEDEVLATLSQAAQQTKQAKAAMDFVNQGTRQEEINNLKARKAEINASLKSQQAKATQARAFVDRLTPLHAEGAVSANEFDEAQNNAISAEQTVNSLKANRHGIQAQLEQALNGPTSPERLEAKASYNAALQNTNQIRARLNDHKLTSPLTGLVLKRLLEPGAVIRAGDPILSLADPRTIQIKGFVEESDLSRVSLNNVCYVLLDAYPQTPIKSVITRIGNEVNPDNGTVEIIVMPSFADATSEVTLLPGMTADINIVTDKLKDAIVLPVTATEKQNGEYYVYKIKSGQIQKTPVKSQRVSLEYLQILEGLNNGDWVAKTAQESLLEKNNVEPLISE